MIEAVYLFDSGIAEEIEPYVRQFYPVAEDAARFLLAVLAVGIEVKEYAGTACRNLFAGKHMAAIHRQQSEMG